MRDSVIAEISCIDSLSISQDGRQVGNGFIFLFLFCLLLFSSTSLPLPASLIPIVTRQWAGENSAFEQSKRDKASLKD